MRDMAAAQVSASAAEVAYLAAVLSDKYVTFALASCYVTCNLVTILLMPTGLSWSSGASMHTYGTYACMLQHPMIIMHAMQAVCAKNHSCQGMWFWLCGTGPAVPIVATQFSLQEVNPRPTY